MDESGPSFVCPVCGQRFDLSAGSLLIDTERPTWGASEAVSAVLCGPCALDALADRVAIGS